MLRSGNLHLYAMVGVLVFRLSTVGKALIGKKARCLKYFPKRWNIPLCYTALSVQKVLKDWPQVKDPIQGRGFGPIYQKMLQL